MQPLDVAFMSPFKTYYAQEISQWLKRHPGRVVTVYQVAELFGMAYNRAATVETAINGFRKTGMFPVNRNLFLDYDFAENSLRENTKENIGDLVNDADVGNAGDMANDDDMEGIPKDISIRSISTTNSLGGILSARSKLAALEDHYTMLQINPSKAFYGLKHIQKATEAQAVETLLISDKLFRCQDGDSRKLYVGIADDVKKAGGKVKIFSSLHITGEQLDQLTGIAAILRFAMPEIEDEEEEDSDEESVDM